MSSSRRDHSLRAEARARFRHAALEQALAAPPPPAGPSLTDAARELYEGSVVPVREIALICGVTERTIYKYVQRGEWRRRWRSIAKGAGGRFVALAQADAPVARGLMATDPAGAARAVEACRVAAELAADAVARTQASRDARADRYALGHLAKALRELSRIGREDIPWRVTADRPAKRNSGTPRRRPYEWKPGLVSPLPDVIAKPPPASVLARDGVPPTKPPAKPPAAPVDPELERRINAVAEEYYARAQERGPRIRRLW